nr:hypothetical protein [Tanacetum cinerariifolium]
VQVLALLGGRAVRLVVADAEVVLPLRAHRVHGRGAGRKHGLKVLAAVEAGGHSQLELVLQQGFGYLPVAAVLLVAQALA